MANVRRDAKPLFRLGSMTPHDNRFCLVTALISMLFDLGPPVKIGQNARTDMLRFFASRFIAHSPVTLLAYVL